MSHRNRAWEALIEQEARLRKRRRGWLVLGIITLSVPIIVLACEFLLVLVLFLPFEIAEARVHQSLNVYQGATFLYEEAKYIGANTAEKGLYYWTEAPMNKVKNYYEQFLPTFVRSIDVGGYAEWFVTGFNLDGSPIVPPTSPSHFLLGSFCAYQRHYECVSVALVDPSQPDLYRLAITSVGMFRNETPPPGLASIPANGTLLIYSYWIEAES